MLWVWVCYTHTHSVTNIMTNDEHKIILDNMGLTDAIASKFYTVNKRYMSIDYNSLRSLGYLRIVEIVASGSYKTARNPVGYLANAVRNAMIDAVRYERRRTYISDDDTLESLLADDRTEQEEFLDEMYQMRQMISKLPDKDRLVIQYRLQYNLTVPEIATRFGVAKGTVDKWFKRIKTKLRNEWRESHE
jgi:RNA polymerase sigma factor (sigma-70 family)